MVIHNNITTFRMYIIHLIFIYMWFVLLSWLTIVLADENVTCTDGLCTNNTCAYGYHNSSMGCTNVTCTAGLCSNNTCEYGFYNTTIDCVPCNLLKTQYKTEKCCSIYTTSSPYRAVPIENKIYENDTGTVQVVSTPPREICHHLWIEYGHCPRVCNALLPGDFCTLNSDCKDIRSCKGFCCIISDVNCHFCANNTGHCDLCASGMGFNATGNLTCGECPYWRYFTNNTCHLFTNCTAGLYPIFDGNETIDRECQDVPHGYFTNETNQQPVLWTYCVNNTYALGGNSSHDTVCTNKTNCVAGSYVFENIENEDRLCAECIDGFSNITNQLECFNYTNCTSYQSNGTNTSDTICN